MVFALKLWVAILAVGGLNFLSRLSFIAFFASRSMPRWLSRVLKFVPVAMLTALVVPMVIAPGGELITGDSPRIPAALAAFVVAFFTRSTMWTLAVGMAALQALRFAG